MLEIQTYYAPPLKKTGDKKNWSTHALLGRTSKMILDVEVKYQVQKKFGTISEKNPGSKINCNLLLHFPSYALPPNDFVHHSHRNHEDSLLLTDHLMLDLFPVFTFCIHAQMLCVHAQWHNFFNHPCEQFDGSLRVFCAMLKFYLNYTIYIF